MPSDPDGPRVAVVGAGIAGLACARSLLVQRPGLAVTVYEGSSRVGGKLTLGAVGGTAVDLGAESVLNRRPEATALARAVGLGESLVYPAVSGAGVWTRDSIRALPTTLMGIPVGVPDQSPSGVLSSDGARRAARETELPRLSLTDDVGFGLLVAERLGSEVRDLLVEPLLGGVYAGRSDEISTFAAVPPLASAVGEHGYLLAAARAVTSAAPGSDAPVFAGIRGGVGRLPGAVARDICARGGSLALDSPVRGLARTTDGWHVLNGPTTAERTQVFDAVVVAVPAAPAARLLRTAVPAASSELGSVEYASMAVVTLAYRSADVDVTLGGTGFLVPPVDGRLIKAATYSSRKWSWQAGDVTVLRCSVGRHREEAALQRDDRELVRAAGQDIRTATGLTAEPIDAAVTRWGGALPQYAVGHLDRIRRAREAVAAVPGVALCGAACDGVGIPAVIASGHAAATRVLAALNAAGTMRS
jgi:oxygen-dependent protoporphyrinogen oxidase